MKRPIKFYHRCVDGQLTIFAELEVVPGYKLRACYSVPKWQEQQIPVLWHYRQIRDAIRYMEKNHAN